MKEQYQPPEGEDKDEMLAMNQETWRRYPPDQNWLSDLIQTLLVDEMFRAAQPQTKQPAMVIKRIIFVTKSN